MSFKEILYAELLKLRRSRITWTTLLAYGAGPLIGALFMIILKDPALGRRMGLIAAKARWSAGSADWPTFLSMMLQMTGVAGMILIGVIAAYVFGREYAESTAKNVLALPIRREWFILGKITVIAIWFAALSLAFCIETVLVGLLVGLPGYSPGLVLHSMAVDLEAAALLVLLCPVAAWTALAGKGYFAPLGVTIITLILGMVFGSTGWAPWVPWSIVPLLTGVAGPEARQAIGTGSYAVLAAVFVVGVSGAMIHINRADNTQ
jgi:ABC-2 type transport system permease protein